MATERSLRYYVTIRGEERVVDLVESGEERRILLDGQPVDAELTALHGASLYSLLLDGHSRELVLDREGDKTFVSLDGERIELRVQDEVSRALAEFGPSQASGDAEIEAPMPGVVVELLVSEGDEIAAGQAVIVVEAMKMQNELCAEAEGIVDRIAVAAGDTVSGGDTLVVLRAKDGES